MSHAVDSCPNTRLDGSFQRVDLSGRRRCSQLADESNREMNKYCPSAGSSSTHALDVIFSDRLLICVVGLRYVSPNAAATSLPTQQYVLLGMPFKHCQKHTHSFDKVQAYFGRN